MSTVLELKPKYVEWFSFENQQSPVYVVNFHFSRHPEDARSASTTESPYLIVTISAESFFFKPMHEDVCLMDEELKILQVAALNADCGTVSISFMNIILNL